MAIKKNPLAKVETTIANAMKGLSFKEALYDAVLTSLDEQLGDRSHAETREFIESTWANVDVVILAHSKPVMNVLKAVLQQVKEDVLATYVPAGGQ